MLMKLLILLIPFLILSCSTVDKNLQKAISYGDVISLNEYSSEIDKRLFVRMLNVPEYKEGCFKETNGPCHNRYFLTVSTFDEKPETNIYPLKARGEVVDVAWHESTENDMADITITMSNHTILAFENNPELKREKILIRVNLTTHSIDEWIEVSNGLE